MMSKKKRIGIIGLGSMGKSMARNLLEAGFELTVYDIRPEPIAELVNLGAKSAERPREVGEGSDIVFVMVLNFEQVESCTAGPDGVLSGMKTGSTLIVTSTIAPSEIKRISEVAAERGINTLDAPVSGGANGAAAGTLVIMVGGDELVFEECKEALMAVGSNTRKVGDAIGIGQVVKAANQLMVTVHLVAMAEAMVLGTKAGADPVVLAEVIQKSAGNSWMFEQKIESVLDGDFSTRGALDIQIKDIDICLRTGRELNVPLYTSAASREVFLWANGLGFGREDASAVIKGFEQVAGVEVRRTR